MRVVFVKRVTESDVALNLKLLGQDPEFLRRVEEVDTHCIPEEGVRAVEEAEVLLKTRLKLYKTDILKIAGPGWPPKWKKLD